NNTFVGSVTATDPDNVIVEYKIMATGVPFKMNVDTGTITVSGNLNFEGGSSYTFNVRARDGQGLTDTESVTVNITNLNDAPVVSGPQSSYTIPENQPFTFSASASDED